MKEEERTIEEMQGIAYVGEGKSGDVWGLKI